MVLTASCESNHNAVKNKFRPARCCTMNPMSSLIHSTFVFSLSLCQSWKLVLDEEIDFWGFGISHTCQLWQITLVLGSMSSIELSLDRVLPPSIQLKRFSPYLRSSLCIHLISNEHTNPPPLLRYLCHHIQWGHSGKPMSTALVDETSL